VTVAESKGEILGWGSLSPFHPREAYHQTVENSIYVRHDALRRGVGSTLLADLIQRATDLGYHTMIAGIDTEQTGSITLHEKFGFEQVAHLKEVGHKFGRWLDVIYLQLMLTAHSS
jgi:phosphinothricin acetyltransferase